MRQGSMPREEEAIMYRCSLCNHLSAPRERAYQITIETRPKEYYKEIKGRMHLVGHGQEIVKEAQVCRECKEIKEKEGA